VVRRYPLESLAAVRQLSKERRALDLRRQARRAENAKAALASARAAHQQCLEAAATIEVRERARVTDGRARAGDLAATAAWRSAAEQQAADLAQQVRKAERQHSDESAAQDAARKALAAAEADAKATDQHRARWQSSTAARAQTCAEDEAAEVWLNRQPAPGSRKRDRGS
jgi:hypothetical protein